MAAPILYAVVSVLVYINTVSSEVTQASVYCKNGEECTYVLGALDYTSTAYGMYNDTLLTTGWGILNITAGHGFSQDNVDIMFAAGYLEGLLTQKRIYQHFLNLNDYYKTAMHNNSQLLAAVKKFFNSQDTYMRRMIKENTPSSAYWRHAAYILAQYDGLIKGYGAVAPSEEQLDVYAFQVLGGNGDMLDLMTALNPKGLPDFNKMTKAEALDYVSQHGHCSALIKVLGAYEDLFMSHSSWFVYQVTMRIFKHYDFNIADAATAAQRISFSSYPGYLNSLDDFYLLGSQMVMLQTSNGIFNRALYERVTPESLLAWHRVRLAHMMAHSGTEWAMLFSEHNSGTYTNQYMIIDLKKVRLNEDIQDGALTVVEQIPGLVDYVDATPILRTGYFPSYNVPFIEQIYNLSGYADFAAKHGPDFSYQLAPRAKIFRRDQDKVVDMDSMKAIMRYNDYKTDPYSEDNPCNTICCRGDLRSTNPRPGGCYDTKVSDYKMALNFQASIINGPTRGSGQSLAPFRWTPEATQSHVGLPPVYDFDFIHTQPLPTPGI